MSDDRPWIDECDNCDHERWNHGEDEGRCGFGGCCDCHRFTDERKEAFLAYFVPLLNDASDDGVRFRGAEGIEKQP